ncbi:SubName: Full=Related to Cytochrome P450 {ECO:0000313/EMBL:CCA73387.1} [Serendipita indica DSM 11827]|nr:SubName: Full=Related to Cytochrome P450 {ECO:0000313/EMBL:CCA73387.1} [Serendipita indica DSM 11827]
MSIKLFANAILTTAGAFVIWVLVDAAEYILRPLVSPARKLRGPPSSSFVFGHMMDEDAPNVGGSGEVLHPHEIWRREYGHVYATRAFLGEIRCMLFDPRALSYVLENHATYTSPRTLRYILQRILGEGLIVAQGAEHKHQRRLLLPAFSSSSLRELVPIFHEKAIELRDKLLAQTRISDKDDARIDMLHQLSLTALDIIGEAGFGYKFNALQEGTDASELSAAFHGIFSSSSGLGAFFVIKAFLPPFRLFIFDKREREIRKARRTMHRVGLELIRERLKEAKRGEEDSSRKDLLSLMVRSNLSTDLPPEQRLSLQQILNQIPTFILAGHETTSTSLAWCLFSLSQHKECQQRLRLEILEAMEQIGFKPSMDQLDSLPYLDAVVKETIRFHPATENAFRKALVDDVIPVSKPYVDIDGRQRTEISVKKGDVFMIPTFAINHLEEVWGPGANQFQPERWLSGVPPSHVKFGLPEGASYSTWGWGGSMTFLSGQRACIGFRFAVLEMKAILFQLVSALEFNLSVPASDIGKAHMYGLRSR